MDFRVLGPLEVEHDGQAIPLGGPKQRAVLAHLVVHANRPVGVDRLVDEIWGDEPPDAVLASLHAYVSRLRALLGRDRIEGRTSGYVLRADSEEVDALRFEALIRTARRLRAIDPRRAGEMLREALSLWRGEPLAGLADGLGAGAGTVLRAEAAHLAELRQEAIDERVAIELAVGQEPALVGELETLLMDDPLREPLWGHLMLALYRSGRQADALDAYRRARELLRDELGIDPSPDLQRLQLQILRQDPQLAQRGLPLRGYRLLGQIGSGTFGVVHRAIQPGVGREVALKAIHPHLADHPDFIRRFESEAQLVARLEHPQIVPLYDYWRDADGAYLVMRWLRGGNLRSSLAEGPLAPDAAARILDQVAAGLAAAHRHDIVHRDVKPANILLDEDGNAYLSDFGIARELATAEARSGDASAEATGYLSPEELRGEPVSLQTDVYALGIVLFEMLTGSHPYAGGRPESPLSRLSDGPRPTVTSLRPDVPGGFDDVIRTAMARRPGDRFTDAEAMSVAAWRALGRAPPRRAVHDRPTVANPYKGLHPFVEADAADFFGREAMVDRLVARLAETGEGCRFLALVGPSGSGKSSLVRAGLLPALRQGAVPGSERWFVVDALPAGRPVGELVAELPDDGSEVLLLIDQFEELFTTVDDEEVRRRALDDLCTALDDPHGRLRVLITLRADFYDRPLAYRRFAELIRARTEPVVPLSADELERAVSGPAVRAGVALEPGFLAQAVADVADEPGALPLLQYALTETFERRDGAGLTLATYHAIGGIAGALARRAEELFEQLSTPGRTAVRELLLRLVTLGEGSEDTRHRVRRSELSTLGIEAAVLDKVLAALGRHRLLLFDRDPDSREPTVEIAHEALLRAWPRLRDWIDAAREDLRIERRLAQAAAEWAEAGRERSFVLSGSRLHQVDGWAREEPVALSQLEHELLDASRAERAAAAAEEDERRQREATLERRSVSRLRALVAVLAGAAVVAGGLALFAFDQQLRAEREARFATSRELAAAALDSLEIDPDLGLLLAIEAVETTRDRDGIVLRAAEEALHEALQASRVLSREPADASVIFSTDLGHRGVRLPDRLAIRDVATAAVVASIAAPDATILAVSRDRRYVATAGGESGAVVWEAGTGERVLDLPERLGPLTALAFAPDGGALATITAGGGAHAWQVPGGDALFSLRLAGADAPSGGGVALAWSPDGRWLAIPAGSETVLHDVAAGRSLHVLPGDGRSVAVSPDGRRLLTTGQDTVTLWDAGSGGQLHALTGVVGFVNAAAFSPDGRLAATGSHDGLARVWDVETGRLMLALAGMGASVDALAFSPDGTRLMGRGATGTLAWDITSSGSREALTFAAHAPPGMPNITFSPDGSLLATAGFDGRALIWDAATGDLRLELVGHEGPISDIVFDADGSLIATSSFDGAAKLWGASGVNLRTMLGHTAPAWSVAFSPDGMRLVTTSEDLTARVWDVASGDQLTAFEGHEDFVYDAAWSPDGLTVVSVSNDFTARVWDPTSGTQLRRLVGHEDNIVEQAFDPAGTRVATASFDGTARVWEVATGDTALTLTGHGGIVLDVESSPDGTRWATASLDGTVRLWDAENGLEVLALTGHPDGVLRLAFSPDGRRLAAAGNDGSVRIYAIDLDDLLELARSRLTRGLTDAECRQYLHLEACPAA